MEAVTEIIIDGAKKFGGEIIAAVLLAVALWVFPGLRKIFRKKNGSAEEMQRLLEAIEARRTEEERLKEELRQHERALKQANPQGDEQIYRQLEEELRQAEDQRQEEANRREEIQRQLEALRKSDEGVSNYHKAAIFAVIFVVVLMAFVGIWSLIYPADTKTGEQTLEIIKRVTDKYGAEKISGYYTTLTQIKKQAKLGNAESQFMLGQIYETGGNIDYDDNKGLTYFCLVDGLVEQDYSEAVKWYRKAAEQGDSVAQYRLGNMYENGYGVAKNPAEARKWYDKAAAQGLKDANDELQRLAGDL